MAGHLPVLTVERRLMFLIQEGNTVDVATFLKNHSELNINGHMIASWTPLHYAVHCKRAEIVKLLLTHPDMDVNYAVPGGATPFESACLYGNQDTLEVLLNDPRVDTTFCPWVGCSPLRVVAKPQWGKEPLGCVRRLILSGRNLGDVMDQSRRTVDAYDGVELEIDPKVQPLIAQFTADPERTRHEMRADLGCAAELAADMYALIVFLCDDLLQLKSSSSSLALDPALVSDMESCTAALRFFNMTKKLPMELQMILCHRAMGFMKQNIPHKNSEPAFRSLAAQ